MGKAYKVLEDKCVGCNFCLKECPTKSITTIKDKKAVEIMDGCVGCGICFKICKNAAIVQEEKEQQATICQCCPVHCNVPLGRTGACQRFVNQNGELVRIKPLHVVDKESIKFDHTTGLPSAPLMLGLGAGTNLYSADVPPRFVGKDLIDGVEVVTAVTEAVLSSSGVEVKIDTDEDLGPAGSAVKRDGRIVGYITPSEYGSRIMYIGGSELITGKTGFTVARTMADLLNKEPVTLRTESVRELIIQEGKPPIVDGKQAVLMRVGCGSMIVEGFAKLWMGIVDEVIAVDYDVTALLSTHTTCGVRYGMKPSGVTPVGTYSSPGRYFGTAGKGWGGSNIMNGFDAIPSIDKSKAWPGLKIVVTEPTVERAAYFVLDDNLEPVEKPIPYEVTKVLEFIRDNCELCNTNVSVVVGIGGGVRNVIANAGPLNVNKAVREGKIMITVCGQPTHILAGGGITVEADIAKIPPGSFAWVPTPAVVVPIEVTMVNETYREIGGYMKAIKPMETIKAKTKPGNLLIVTANPVFDSHGQIYMVVANSRNVSELMPLGQKLGNPDLNLQSSNALEKEIIYASPQMKRIVELADKAAVYDSIIMITGESGVGKGLLAARIHRHSRRARAPFTQIYCGAIPATLLESELFGYEQGAFTGAKKEGKKGLIDVSQGGTVFLDEVAELPLDIQVKLLNLIQEKSFYRVGGNRQVYADVRFIAATNRDTKKMVSEGTFREDLYYRLNVVPLTIPPLRSRREDITDLVNFFLKQLNKKLGGNKQIGSGLERFFVTYDWPGNVRELENTIERLIVTCDSELITENDLPDYMLEGQKYDGKVTLSDLCPLQAAREDLERQLLAMAYRKLHNTYEIARTLGINQSTVVRKLHQYRLVADTDLPARHKKGRRPGPTGASS